MAVSSKERLHERYLQEVVPQLQREFNYDNSMMTPRLVKVVVNIGLGEAIQNAKSIEAATKRPEPDHRPEAGRHSG